MVLVVNKNDNKEVKIKEKYIISIQDLIFFTLSQILFKNLIFFINQKKKEIFKSSLVVLNPPLMD